jgi:hypothetical protein
MRERVEEDAPRDRGSEYESYCVFAGDGEKQLADRPDDEFARTLDRIPSPSFWAPIPKVRGKAEKGAQSWLAFEFTRCTVCVG